ncbi:MAG: hypothetical protein KatS3mg082_1758 [Nitrospiraceae bacterium]|nr:MAG: hypothetical protein KatS3mg082_1758 [Nitrospiraceae bacterium]
MKTYTGIRGRGGCEVIVNGTPLNPRLDLVTHSPTGFEWGYLGSGPAQLALAILADHLMDDQKALAIYQEFKRDVIAHLPRGGWNLTDDDVQSAIDRIIEERTYAARGTGADPWN